MDNSILDSLDYLHFLSKLNNSFFRKNFLSEYKMTSNQPWIYFQNPEDEKLSFRIHDLEFGEEKYALDWHAVAQRKEQAVFNGSVSRLYNFGIGDLGGFLETEKEFGLGLIIKNQRVNKMFTLDKRLDLFGTIHSYIEGLEKCKVR